MMTFSFFNYCRHANILLGIIVGADNSNKEKNSENAPITITIPVTQQLPFLQVHLKMLLFPSVMKIVEEEEDII